MAIDRLHEVQANVSVHASGPGEELRRAREARGLSIAQASEATCILARYLRALEEDAPLDVFPAPIYARFFLREYARYLGLDERPLLDVFDQRHGGQLEPRLAEIPMDRPERRGRWRPPALLSALVLAALVGLSLTARGPAQAPRPSPPPSPPGSVAAGGAVLHPRDPDLLQVASPPVVRRIRAVVVASERCWIRAIADGEVVFVRTVEPGETVRFRAERELLLRLGNAGGVTLRVNGEPVPTRGTVVDYEFRLRDGELVQG